MKTLLEIFRNLIIVALIAVAFVLFIVAISNTLINAAFSVSARANDVVYICKPTSSETNPWNVIGIDESALETHLSNGAFIYKGEYEKNGRPHPQRSAAWCAEQVTEEDEQENESEEVVDEEDETVPEKQEPIERNPDNKDSVDRGLDGDNRTYTGNPHGDSMDQETAEKFNEITEGK